MAEAIGNTTTITWDSKLLEYINTYEYLPEGSPSGTAASKGGAAILAQQKDLNKFSWQQELLVPGIQAAAQLLILNKQKDDYDDISDDQKDSVDAAVSGYTNCVEALLPSFKDAFPDVPQCAQYIPVNACEEQIAAINCNLQAAGKTDEYIKEVNRQHHINQLIRTKFLIPFYEENQQLQSIQINDLLQGKLPVDDVVEILTDNAEMALLRGRVGNTCKQTLRDLGISRLRAQALGREAFERQLASVNRDVSPVSQLADVQSMAGTPKDRINLALQQALYIQESAQNCFNVAAQKAPHLMHELQAKLQRCVAKLTYEASKANMVNTFVPNYAAILNPLISGLATGAGSLFMGGNRSQYGQSMDRTGGNFGVLGQLGQLGGGVPMQGGGLY